MLREISELESIGDACYNLARIMNRLRESTHDFTPLLYANIQMMMQYCDDALREMNSMMTGHSRDHDMRLTYRLADDVKQLQHKLRADNVRDVNERKYSYAVGTIYSDMISECGKLEGYVVNVVQARFSNVE